MMKTPVDKQTGWRGSEELWLKAAYEMLIEAGIDSVKVMPLARRIKMSRTSFYWHFENRQALLEALIFRWKEKNTGNLISQTTVYAETISEALLNLFDCWVNPDLFDASMEFAIRNWAHQSADLKEILDNTDRERIAAIRSLFERYGFNPIQADIRAHTVYYTQVGYIAMMVDEPLTERLEKMPAYVETFAGSYPSKSEISRFRSRHTNS